MCDGNEAGNSCVFTCERGYNLIGSKIRHCLQTMNWSGVTTSCNIMTCETLTNTENAHLNLPCSAKYNTSCSIRCVDGYTLTGSDIQQCIFDDKTREVKWTSESSSCNSKLMCLTICVY